MNRRKRIDRWVVSLKGKEERGWIDGCLVGWKGID